tara:strand:- start:86 stop:751 length:666 start_codon:yes stop_codon:yes gene_type:complete
MRIQKQKGINQLWDFWAPVLFTIFLYTGIRSWIAEARYIPSGSMIPALQIEDRLLIEKITYRIRPPKRGEIVVFNSPYSFDPILKKGNSLSQIQCAFLTFPIFTFITGIGHPSCDAYIKRIVATSGDKVFVNSKAQVYINDVLVNEPYINNYCTFKKSNLGNCKSITAIVPEGNVLVLGDNRNNSWDARFWPGGPFLPEEEIVGRAIWRFWPFNRMGGLHF